MNINRIAIVLSIVVFVASVVLGVRAQSEEPDRISFYNVPGDSGKLESHIDYADGGDTKIKYPAALCTQGTVITQTLNLYTASFVAEGCEATVFQQLNLRWLGGCEFEFEHDPQTYGVAHGAYGHVVIADGLYDQGAYEFGIPFGTTAISVVMSHTVGGELWTGNVGYLFATPIGCVDAPLQAATATPTATMADTATATPDAPQTPTATATETETPAPTATPETGTGGLSTPTPEVPTMTPTATATPTVTPPPENETTDEETTGEPGRMVYLPVVDR